MHEATATECAARAGLEQSQQLFDQHQWLARVIAKEWVKRLKRADLYEDFEQAALLGLWDAAQRFDPTKAIAFSTYAPQRIRGEILDWIRSQRGRGPAERMTQQRFEAGMKSIDRIIRWDSTHGERTHKDKSPADLIVAPQEVDQVELRETVRKLLACLPVNARCALRCYFLEGLTMRETGKYLNQGIGLSEARVSQLISQSLQRLRKDYASHASAEP